MWEFRVAEFEFHLLGPESEVLGSDHRDDRVGSGADVTRRAGDVRRPVSLECDAGRGGHLKRTPDPGGSSPADQQPPIAHRARLHLPILPSELLRSESVTLPERLT